MDGSYWRDLVRPTYEGRRWILALDAAVAAGDFIELLAEYGAEKGFVIAGQMGTGDPPDPELAEIVVLGTSGETMVTGIRNYHAALADLPDDVVARLDAWDPDRSAQVLTGFLTSDQNVAGRRIYGARRPEWEALEDKIAILSVWDAAGVQRAPAEVVAVDRAELLAAHKRLDWGSGTVWAGDNREGWHGGAELLRWIRGPDDVDEAVEHLGSQCDIARVMPFLEGLPCSVHGMVFDDYVAAFRPAEMIILRRRASNKLQYCGIANFWDPAPADADYMRDVVRRVGAHLDRTLGYRGAFGIDGVLTDQGFLPTELNARYSPGLFLQAAAVDGLYLGTLNRAVIGGEDYDFRPRELEALILEASRENRRSRGVYPVDTLGAEETVKQPIVFDDGGVRPADEGEEAHGELSFGPASMGGIVFCALANEHTPIGPPVAPKIIPALQLAGELWGFEVGDLEPAV